MVWPQTDPFLYNQTSLSSLLLLLLFLLHVRQVAALYTIICKLGVAGLNLHPSMRTNLYIALQLIKLDYYAKQTRIFTMDTLRHVRKEYSTEQEFIKLVTA